MRLGTRCLFQAHIVSNHICVDQKHQPCILNLISPAESWSIYELSYSFFLERGPEKGQKRRLIKLALAY
jgi:hypothetical protein